MQFTNKIHLAALRADLEAAVRSVAEKHGISIKTGKIRFMDQSCSVSLECATIGEGGILINKDAEAFKLLATGYGLKPSDLGRVFVTAGKSYTICGLRPSSPKYPLLAKDSNGKIFKFTERIVAMSVGYNVTPV